MHSQSTRNVDTAELARFNALAARWWDPQGEFKALHDINPLRLEYIDRCAPLRGCKVLDVGCGGGILAESMAVMGAEVTAIDMAEQPLKIARLHLKESGAHVEYHLSTAEEYAEHHAGEFDTVTCMELLEHVPDPAKTVNACTALVRPGGDVFFATINRHPVAFAGAIIAAEYLLRLLPKGTHQYEKFIKPSELEDWARHAGLQARHMSGMHYNPLTQSYFLARNTHINYLIHFRKKDDR